MTQREFYETMLRYLRWIIILLAFRASPDLARELVDVFFQARAGPV